VILLDLRRLSSVADFFVLATVASQRQMRAIIESVETDLKRLGQRVRHVEGRAALRPGKVGAAHDRASSPDSSDGLSWVVMDCGVFVVHLLSPPARQFYQLERLWGDAPRTSITS
jgi:ribosome-associated protein